MAKYFPEEEEKEQSTPEGTSADTEVVIEKKSGLLSKVLALVIGVVIGIAGTIGGVVGAGIYLLKQPVKKAVVTVDNYFDEEDVYSLVFGEADEDGIRGDGYLSEEYANKKIGFLLGDTGRALASLASGKGTLSDLTVISPKLDTAIRNFLRIAYQEYGIDIDKDGFMTTPVSGMEDFLADTIYNSPLGDVLDHLMKDHTASSMLMALCYGEKGVDYYIDEATGDIVMIGDAKKRTIGDLKDHSDEAFDSIALSAIIPIDHDEEVMMYLAYGKKDVHYTLNDDEVVMLQKRIGIYNGKAYNAYGEPMPGTLNGMTYTDGDTTYLLASKVKDSYGNDVMTRTTDSPEGTNTYATMYYVTDAKGKEIFYHHTTFGDLTDGGIIKNLTSRLTLGEVLGETAIESNRFLKHVQNETIATLPNAIEKLSIQDVFEDQIYLTQADGSFVLDANGNRILKGEWWYLLTVNGVEQEYAVTEMDELINNMRVNIENASLQKLKDDGMITTLEQDSLDQPLRTSVGSVMLPVPAGKTKLGELTVLELLDYVDQCLAAIETIP